MEKKFENNCLEKNDTKYNSINNIFNQLSNSNEFQQMIYNINKNLQSLNNENNDTLSSEDDSNNINTENPVKSIFIGKNNKNICDCLIDINDTLLKLLKIF